MKVRLDVEEGTEPIGESMSYGEQHTYDRAEMVYLGAGEELRIDEVNSRCFELNCSYGRLVVEPVATNVVRIRIE